MIVTAVEISGFDRMEAVLAPERLNRAAERTLVRGSREWADTTKKMPPVSGPKQGYAAKGIPVDSGLTRQEIRPLSVQMLAAGVIAPTNYASYVREGTARMPGRDFFLFALEDFGALQRINEIAHEELSLAMNA